MNKKNLVLYHRNCNDGFGAALAAWLHLGDTAEYKPVQYDEEFDVEETTDKVVYILDFSFDLHVMQEIMRRASRVIWLDHHKSAFIMWLGKAFWVAGARKYFSAMKDDPANSKITIVLDDSRSGAGIAWDYFNSTPQPILIQYIQDRDLWKKEMSDSDAFTYNLNAYDASFETWKALMDLIQDPDACEKFLQDGRSIHRYINIQVARIVKNAVKIKLPCGEEVGYAVNSSGLQSELGHVLASQSKAYGVVWSLLPDGDVPMATVSLRGNKGGIDVSSIAEIFGGGGHSSAAGFRIPVSELLSYMDGPVYDHSEG